MSTTTPFLGILVPTRAGPPVTQSLRVSPNPLLCKERRGPGPYLPARSDPPAGSCLLKMTDLLLPPPFSSPGHEPGPVRSARTRGYVKSKEEAEDGDKPVLAKHMIDAVTPATVASKRGVLQETGNEVAPVTLFDVTASQGLDDSYSAQDMQARAEIVHRVDDKVARMIQMHLRANPRCLNPSPNLVPVSSSNIGLSLSRRSLPVEVYQDSEQATSNDLSVDSEEDTDSTRLSAGDQEHFETVSAREVDTACPQEDETAAPREVDAVISREDDLKDGTAHLVDLAIALDRQAQLTRAWDSWECSAFPGVCVNNHGNLAVWGVLRLMRTRTDSVAVKFILHRWKLFCAQTRALHVLVVQHVRRLLRRVLQSWSQCAETDEGLGFFFATGSRGVFGQGLVEQRAWSLQHRIYVRMQRNGFGSWKDEVHSIKKRSRRRGLFSCLSLSTIE